MKDQRQQVVQQAFALCFLEDAKTTPIKRSGSVKANSKAPTTRRAAPKNVQATPTQSSSTKVRTTESKTDKKMSIVKKNVGATQSKAKNGAVNNTKATPTAGVSWKSTMETTQTTTVSKVYVEAAVNWSSETTIKNVETLQVKISKKLTIKANQGDKKSQTAPKSTTSGPGALVAANKAELKPRRK